MDNHQKHRLMHGIHQINSSGQEIGTHRINSSGQQMVSTTLGEVLILLPSIKVGRMGPKIQMSMPSEGLEKLREKERTTKAAKADIKDHPGDGNSRATKEAAKAIKAGCMGTRADQVEKAVLTVGKMVTSRQTARCRRCVTTAAVFTISVTTAPKTQISKLAKEKENLAKQESTISSREALVISPENNKMTIPTKKDRSGSTLCV